MYSVTQKVFLFIERNVELVEFVIEIQFSIGNNLDFLLI